MEMKRFSVAALAVVASVLSGSAVAQNFMGGPMWGQGWAPSWGRGYMMVPGRGRFSIVDVDQNGIVSDEEAASSADEVFSAMDLDDNGELSKDEYMTIRMGPQDGWNTERQAAREAAKEAQFDALDLDKNGTVSRADFIANAKAHFDAADKDGDGKVTPWEWRSEQWN